VAKAVFVLRGKVRYDTLILDIDLAYSFYIWRRLITLLAIVPDWTELEEYL